jgi:hypothetical protein
VLSVNLRDETRVGLGGGLAQSPSRFSTSNGLLTDRATNGHSAALASAGEPSPRLIAAPTRR